MIQFILLLSPLVTQAIPLGDYLTRATRENLLKGEYMDVFSLLFWELEKKDKEDLDD